MFNNKIKKTYRNAGLYEQDKQKENGDTGLSSNSTAEILECQKTFYSGLSSDNIEDILDHLNNASKRRDHGLDKNSSQKTGDKQN